MDSVRMGWCSEGGGDLTELGRSRLFQGTVGGAAAE